MPSDMRDLYLSELAISPRNDSPQDQELLMRHFEGSPLLSNHFEGSVLQPLWPSQMVVLYLAILNLGENHFSGGLPAWIGTGLPNLKVLRLRCNMFVGHVPEQLCSLSYIQLLDVANNELCRSIPQCFENLTSMTTNGSDEAPYIGDLKDEPSYIGYQGGVIINPVSLTITVKIVKGTEREFSGNLNLLRGIDLSSNNMSGMIPEELTELVGLRILNLSVNHFTGKLPQDIGHLKELEGLDLSRNQLSGSIPSSLSALNYLSGLNLSNNDLSGRILTGSQHQLNTR